MEDQKVIKYFDFVIENLQNPSGFSINNTLFDSFNPESPTERESFLHLCSKVKAFGKLHGYWKSLSKDSGEGGFFLLTEKGLELREYGKGHRRFKRKQKSKPLDWYKIIGLLLTFIFGCSTIYFAKKNFELNKSTTALKSEVDTLKTALDSCNSEKLKTSSRDSIILIPKVNE